MAKKIIVFLIVLLVLMGSAFVIFYFSKKDKPVAEGLMPILKISPESGTFKVGDKVVLKIGINAPQKIKSAKIVLGLDLNKFKIDKIDKGALSNYRSPEIRYEQNKVEIYTYEDSLSAGWSGDNLFASIDLIVLASIVQTEISIINDETEIILTTGESVLFESKKANFSITETNLVKPQVDLKINGNDQEASLAQGSSATLSWTTKNADSCSASNALQGEKSTEGQESTGELRENSTFVLSCSNSAGSAIDSVNTKILTTLPQLDLTINDVQENTIKIGEAIKLNWRARPEDVKCEAIGDWAKEIGSSGEKIISDINIAQTYSMVCTNNVGRSFSSVKVKVGNSPPNVELKANNIDGPLEIDANTNFQLEWSSNAISCEAGGDWFGTKPPIGIEIVNGITDFKNYQLTCASKDLSASDNVIVAVRKVLGESGQTENVVLEKNEQPSSDLPQNLILENNSNLQKTKITQSATVKKWVILVFYILIPFILTTGFILGYWYVRLKGYTFNKKKNGKKIKTNR